MKVFIISMFLACSEFCDFKNEGLDITPEEIPQGESFDFVLVPARPQAEAENAEQTAAGETTPEKKESKGMIVYCMDISGSMNCTVRMPELQGICHHLDTHLNPFLQECWYELRDKKNCLKTGFSDQ